MRVIPFRAWRPNRSTKTDEQWREELTPEQYEVLRKGSTERAFTGQVLERQAGRRVPVRRLRCALLFTSDEKFDSGSGWPSFWDVVDEGRVELHDDNSLGMKRVGEVTCATCGGHLGHLFPDRPRETTGLRYCINSCALELDPGDSAASTPNPT